MILTLKILGAIAAFALGIWFGLPGRYTQTVDEIEDVMERGYGRRRKTKRHFTPLAWLQRRISARPSHSRNRGRGGFKLENPDDL